MVEVSIDRLTLRLPHGYEGEARLLAQLLAENLTGALDDVPGGTVSRLSLSLQARPGESPERLSERIATALAEQIAAMRE